MVEVRSYRYVGEPMLTRGEFGERIERGYTLDGTEGCSINEGCIYVWDSTYGHTLVCPEEDAESFGFVLETE